jgi:hypothetical protein
MRKSRMNSNSRVKISNYEHGESEHHSQHFLMNSLLPNTGKVSADSLFKLQDGFPSLKGWDDNGLGRSNTHPIVKSLQ